MCINKRVVSISNRVASINTISIIYSKYCLYMSKDEEGRRDRLSHIRIWDIDLKVNVNSKSRIIIVLIINCL